MKFEFGDLYKFIVSLGVVIISLAILAPWFFLKEPFDLFKTKDELEAVTDVAKIAIHSRQKTVSFILSFIPWFSSIGALVGGGFICFGLKNWRGNQLLLDEQTKLEVEIKKQSLRDATKDEIDDKESEEYALQPADEKEPVANEQAFISFIGHYSQTEKIVFNKLSNMFGKKYNIYHNRMVAGIELDILMEGKSMFTKDYLIEVKYIRKGFNYGWLKESFLKHLYAKNIYSQVTNRIPNTLFLIIMDQEAMQNQKHVKLINRVQEEKLGRQGKDKIAVISKSELMSIESDNLQEKLGIIA